MNASSFPARGLVCGAVALLCASAQATTYHVLDLGPGVGTAINASGVVAGSVQDATTPWLDTPVRYDHGVVTPLGSLGGTYGVSGGIADDGTIVGQSINRSGVYNAFRWAGGTMKNLGTLTASHASGWSAAVGITRKRHVCGAGQSDTPTGESHAWIVKGGKMQDLGTPPGTQGSSVAACNSRDHLAATAFAPVTGNPHATLFHDGVMEDLGDFAGGAGFSVAYGINDQDEVVGMASRGPNGAGLPMTAFHWKNGTMQDLGVIPGSGATISWAVAIGADGTIIGTSGVAGNDVTRTVAFIFRGKTMTDLNALVDADAVQAGWRLTNANAINAAGQITGTGMLDGVYHAYLATPQP